LKLREIAASRGAKRAVAARMRGRAHRRKPLEREKAVLKKGSRRAGLKDEAMRKELF
jgi:hypothetical protein